MKPHVMPDSGKFTVGLPRREWENTLSAEARAELRALASAGEDSAAVAERAATLVVTDALGRSVTAETMIIAVKREWSMLDEVRAIGSAAEARALLDRLVTRCIDAFYSRRQGE